MPGRLPNPRDYGYLIAISQVGFEMVVPIGLGVGLDLWLHTLPWLTIVGVLLGLFGGIAHLIVLIDRMDKAEKSETPNSPREPQ
jgi:F0F1-type ATP synthase assembly protein I